MSSPLRTAVERRSTPALVRLRTLPPAAPFLVMLVLVLGGLFAPPFVGAVLLALVALVLGWLTYLAWPVLPGNGRLLRVVAVAVAAVGIVLRLANG